MDKSLQVLLFGGEGNSVRQESWEKWRSATETREGAARETAEYSAPDPGLTSSRIREAEDFGRLEGKT